MARKRQRKRRGKRKPNILAVLPTETLEHILLLLVDERQSMPGCSKHEFLACSACNLTAAAGTCKALREAAGPAWLLLEGKMAARWKLPAQVPDGMTAPVPPAGLCPTVAEAAAALGYWAAVVQGGKLACCDGEFDTGAERIRIPSLGPAAESAAAYHTSVKHGSALFGEQDGEWAIIFGGMRKAADLMADSYCDEMVDCDAPPACCTEAPYFLTALCDSAGAATGECNSRWEAKALGGPQSDLISRNIGVVTQALCNFSILKTMLMQKKIEALGRATLARQQESGFECSAESVVSDMVGLANMWVEHWAETARLHRLCKVPLRNQAAVGPADPLLAVPHPVTGIMPERFPATLGKLQRLSAKRTDRLMAFYGLRAGPREDLATRRRRLAQFLGCWCV